MADKYDPASKCHFVNLAGDFVSGDHEYAAADGAQLGDFVVFASTTFGK